MSVSAPPAVTTVPPGSVAFADALAIVTATAAATDTGPPDVDADGVELASSTRSRRCRTRAPPAFERSPAT